MDGLLIGVSLFVSGPQALVRADAAMSAGIAKRFMVKLSFRARIRS
jgi:hypothetical protein